MPTRRTILKLGAAPLLLGQAPSIRAASRHVVVVGAGAFGGWTAWWLARRGARVTLVDAWGPGNMRASSGGETRVIRGIYGDRAVYTTMAARALRLWREREQEWQTTLYHRTGALWMFADDASFGAQALPAMKAEGLPVESLTIDAGRRRWPQIDFQGLSSLLHEPEAGYLLARRACATVTERARGLGVEYRVAAVKPLSGRGAVDRLALEDGGTIVADAFVLACGPWLGRVVPDLVGAHVEPTRQEVFYFGPAPGDTRFDDTVLPVWIENTSQIWYGIPGNAHRGFKLADDTKGAVVDPTTLDRRNTPAEIDAARAYLRKRFPGLADAPFLGGEVCQYENSPDGHFLIDRHPAAPNVWIAGGGSGHGFKMGPALGELLADLVLAERDPDPQFRLSRLGRR